LRFMLRDEAFQGHTEFYQISEGMRVVYSRTAGEFLEFSYGGHPITDDQLFTVGIQSYHFSNLEKFLNITYAELERYRKPRVISTSCLDIIEEYLSAHPTVSRDVEGRILITE
ncbi:MAG: bifunctional metallophosphatase/5'-nucleotidase, partial [Clostridia bacterium]|nr:bifunctional metallophosphatase/5'-nucleotidase [Clostridia bacterium]